MFKPNQDLKAARPEVDTHKEVLNERQSRKARGQDRHANKCRKDTKWFDKWN